MTQPQIITIDKLLNNAMGLARTEAGEVLFVPDALPGEQHRILATRRQKSVLTATQTERISDAPFRVTPSCPHAADCGGCGLLHIHRDHETDQKIAYLSDTLTRIAKWPDAPILAQSFEVEQSRIRGKFHLSEDGIPGFRQTGGHKVTAIDSCQVIPRSVRDALPAVAKAVSLSGFKGEIHFATDAQRQNPVLEFNGRFAKTLKTPIPGIAGYLIAGRNKPISRGESRVGFDWNGLKVKLTAARFFQSNPNSWPYFFKWVDRFHTAFSPQVIWDVHAGSGFLSSRIPRGLVLCSEPDQRAWPTLRDGLPTAQRQVRLFQGTAEAALAQSDFPNLAEALILDPPREGLSKPLRNWIVNAGPAGLLYFSCDMGSFARDLRVLLEAYRPTSEVLAMNLNPGSTRLETAVILERREH